ncbi:MAG: PfkB family carbohydrate kinase [Nitriliruptorales bacterium]|nr:PfkB family carbohydrate kinase [Nitriliruptorales bacterium]
MICTIGDLVEDVVVILSGPPRPGSDVDAQISRHRGGSAANVAAAAARLSGQARFVGQVGDDELGDRLASRLREDGVDVVTRRAGRTGTIVALVAPDGERTMLTDRGASPRLDGTERAWLEGVAVLHVPAYSLAIEPLASSTRQLAELAHEAGIPVTIDTSSVAVLEAMDDPRQQFADLAPAIVFANRDEADQLDLDNPLTDDGWLVIKRGASPTMLTGPGSQRLEVPVLEVDVVDTTGAGDAFAAGFLTAWVDGAHPSQAAAAGHRAAAKVVTHPGSGVEDP